MKPLNEMSHQELADLVDFVSSYQTTDRWDRKITLDFKMAAPVLRGESQLSKEFKFLSRSAANEELPGAGFIFAIYAELIDRLQPPPINLTDGEFAVLESIANTGFIHREIYADGGARGNEQKRVIRKLYDVGLIENPTYNALGMKLSPAGASYLKENLQPHKRH